MIAFRVPTHYLELVELKFLAYRFHTCCAVLFTRIPDSTDYYIDWDLPENKRARETCGGCEDRRREHDWGDV